MIIVIVGPTGVGKTKLSVELAKRFNGEVINADSMQVYKGLDIATAKIKEEEKEGIPHHLFDICEVEENFSVYDYQKLGREKIDEITKMNLDLINNLIKSTKENNAIQNFIKELGEFLENNIGNSERNEEPLVQKILAGRTLITRYRDEINIKRHDIINNYSKEHSEQGELYYVYNKRSDNTYGIFSYKNGESGTNIGVKESEMPKDAGVDSVLRMQNGKFVFDKEATGELQTELTEMINSLLEEQENRLDAQRIEGHLYEFVEKAGNIVELTDLTNNTGECFEEIAFPTELAEKATQGDKFQYINGEYKLVGD